MQNIFVGFFLCLFSMSCWANFYAGIGAGPEWASFNQKSTTKSAGQFDARDRTHLAGDGIFGSLFAGYGWSYKCFYLAGELNANLSSVQYENSNSELLHATTQGSKYKLPSSVGITIIPGYQLTDTTLLYARLGYANGNFKLRTTDVSLKNVDTNLSGFHYGIGIKQGLYKRLSGILEYGHTTYQKTTLFAVDKLVTKNTRISPETNQVKLGLVLDFA